MSTDKAFRLEQRQVAIRMFAAVLVTVMLIAGGLYAASGVPQPLDARIAITIKADLFVVFWLFAAIANVARLRFFSPEDIAGSGGTVASNSVRHAGAVLQNTLEQAVLAIPVHLALAAMLERPLPLIIGLVCAFSLGRALFWFGYSKGAAARAFGFALTFYPSAASLLIAILLLLTGSLSPV
jgi:hypothetical protein